MPVPSASSTARHRWLIVLPLVLLLVYLTLREGWMRTADILVFSSDADVWAGGQVWENGDTDASIVDDETLMLEHGSLLMRTPRLATVRAGSWDVHVWAGAAHVTKQGDIVTVVAFDTPVLLTSLSGAVVVEPEHQWKTPASMPDSRLHPAVWLAAVLNSVVPTYFLDEQQVVMGDAVRVAAPVVPSYAAASTAELASLVQDSVPSSELLRAVRARPLLWSFGLVHPALRDIVWTYVEPTATPEQDVWTSILLLPRLARYGDDLPMLTVRRWEEAFAGAAASGGTLSAVVPLLEQDIRALADAGYPLRALRFAEALSRVLEQHEQLSDAAREAADRLRRMTADSLRAQAFSSTADDRVSLTVPEMSDQTPARDPVREQRAQELLAARGFMFTRSSTIRTVDDHTVDVLDVAYGFPSGDRLLRFRYDVAADTVQAIVDGSLQPFAVPLAMYLEWERTR